MNKSYALVWNQALGCWNVASELVKRRGKAGRSKAVLAAGVSLLGLLGQAPAFALPSGGTVVAGNASLQTSADGKHMTVDQQSNKLITNWNEFSVNTDERVSFQQPGSDSIALNRVIGTNGSDIQGRIDANGQVFLVNPNGVVFGKTAQVNVGGLVASTQNIADKDFLEGNYRFAGNSNAAVNNAGTLTARDGGSVALLGAQVSNSGVIQAKMGSVALGAGKDFSVNFDGNGLLNLQVNSGAVDALAYNGGLLKADGGQVLMTAKGANNLLKTVVSNQGVIEAKTLQNKAGKIVLDGGDSGIVQVAGRQDASALGEQGNGGVVENRGAKVEVQLAAQVDTRADKGKTGTWRISSKDGRVAEASSSVDNKAGSTNSVINSVIGNSDNNNISLAGSGNVVDSQIGNGNGNNVSLSGPGNIAGSQIGNGNGNNVSLSGSGDIVNSQIGNGSGNNVNLAGVGSIIGSQIGNNNGTGGNGSGSGNMIGQQIGNNNGTSGSWSGNGNIIGSQIGNNNGNGVNWSGNGSIVGSQIGNNNGNGANWSGLGNIIGQQIGNTNGGGTGAGNIIGQQIGNNNGNVSTASANSVAIGGGINANNGGSVSSGGNAPTVYADTLAKNLANTNIELVSTSGDLSVDAPVSWSSSNKLGLTAERGNVQVNGALDSSGSNAGVQLNAKQGSIQLNENVALTGAGSSLELNHGNNGYALKDGKAVTLSGDGASFHANGQSYEVVQNLEQLRKIEKDMAGHYVLGNAINGTGSFKTIGDGNTFTGALDGLGNTISDLSIYGSTGFVGLFGANNGEIRNLNLERISASGDSSEHYHTLVGTLVGLNFDSGSIKNVKAKDVLVTGASHPNTLGGLVAMNLGGGTIENSSVSGKLIGDRYTYAMGGLVGENITSVDGVAKISNSQADVALSGKMSSDSSSYGAGGLVGLNLGGRIANSSSKGSVNLAGENLNIGGLVGLNRDNGSISNSTSSASVSGGANGLLGGLVGFNEQGSIANSSASGQVSGNYAQAIGGLVGKNLGNALTNVSASGNVSDLGSRNVGGLVGHNAGGTIANASATSTVTGGNNANVGGLVGQNVGGGITNATVTSVVTGGINANVGGLVGQSEGGAIANATATSTVTGGINANVGGLLGYGRGAAITNAAASTSAIGGQNAAVGGLVGSMTGGSVNTSSAKGSAKGGQSSRVGGLVGANASQISNSSASTTVSGGSFASLGGLVGVNVGSVFMSSASGKVDFNPAYGQLYGGLVGMNMGRLSYNSVSGEASKVPMIGRNFRSYY